VDTNIWISKIQHSVNTTAGEYFFTNLKEGNLEKAFARLTDSNDLTLSPTIMLELNLFLKNLEKSYLKDIMDTKFSRRYKEIREKLTKRKKDYMRRYGNFLDISLPYDNLNTIRNFYHYRLRELEKITKVKIYSKTPYNTIKKLVQREGYLPEVNDRKLLSEAIWIQKNTDKQVGILSGDKDFTSFAGDIYKRFKIKIYNAYTIGERIGKKGR